MPPPNKLGMRDAQPLTKRPVDLSIDQRIFNRLEQEKLKNPKPARSAPSPNSEIPQPGKYQVEHQRVLDTIKNRLMNFYPPVLLDEHIVHSPEKVAALKDFARVITNRNTLNGIDILVEDRGKFMTAIQNARSAGESAFVPGSKHDWNKHWPLAVSFKATQGVGFREIFRPKVIEPPIGNPNHVRFDSRLGKDVTVDVSALHIAVSEFPDLNQTRSNIHIDEMTVTLAGIGDDVRISPTVITHLVNELLFKTKLQGKLPDWMIDALEISLLNPNEGFFNAGIGATLVNKPNFSWTIKYSAGLNNSTNPEWSGSFKFEHSVGTGIVVRF